jgi:hypothetical protein
MGAQKWLAVLLAQSWKCFPGRDGPFIRCFVTRKLGRPCLASKAVFSRRRMPMRSGADAWDPTRIDTGGGKRNVKICTPSCRWAAKAADTSPRPHAHACHPASASAQNRLRLTPAAECKRKKCAICITVRLNNLSNRLRKLAMQNAWKERGELIS